jgi:hypothetical protein
VFVFARASVHLCVGAKEGQRKPEKGGGRARVRLLVETTENTQKHIPKCMKNLQRE